MSYFIKGSFPASSLTELESLWERLEGATHEDYLTDPIVKLYGTIYLVALRDFISDNFLFLEKNYLYFDFFKDEFAVKIKLIDTLIETNTYFGSVFDIEFYEKKLITNFLSFPKDIVKYAIESGPKFIINFLKEYPGFSQNHSLFCSTLDSSRVKHTSSPFFHSRFEDLKWDLTEKLMIDKETDLYFLDLEFEMPTDSIKIQFSYIIPSEKIRRCFDNINTKEMEFDFSSIYNEVGQKNVFAYCLKGIEVRHIEDKFTRSISDYQYCHDSEDLYDFLKEYFLLNDISNVSFYEILMHEYDILECIINSRHDFEISELLHSLFSAPFEAPDEHYLGTDSYLFNHKKDLAFAILRFIFDTIDKQLVHSVNRVLLQSISFFCQSMYIEDFEKNNDYIDKS